MAKSAYEYAEEIHALLENCSVMKKRANSTNWIPFCKMDCWELEAGFMKRQCHRRQEIQ